MGLGKLLRVKNIFLNIPDLDYGDGFMGVYISPNLPKCTLYIGADYYTSILP